MPDILHWLGITKIDRMLSMSKYVCLAPKAGLSPVSYVLTALHSMKYDAIVGQG